MTPSEINKIPVHRGENESCFFTTPTCVFSPTTKQYTKYIHKKTPAKSERGEREYNIFYPVYLPDMYQTT